MKILIVEDDPVSRCLLEAKLVMWGYEVVVTCDGNEAWETLHTEDGLALAILDIMMPGMDGIEVCRRMKEDAAIRDIPILFISALSDTENMIKALDAGGVDYITKPFSDGELRARIRTHMAFAAARKELLRINRDLEMQIKAREEAEISLRETEERYRAVVEDQTEIISRFRPDGTFTFVNEVYCRYFGKTPLEVLGSRWHPVAVPQDVSLIEEKLRSISPANPVVTIENRISLDNGELRWMQFVNRGLFDDNGVLVEIQSVGRDITEQKSLEEQLRQSQKMEAVGLLAGGVAHNFNNILQVIMGYGQILLIRVGEENPLRLYVDNLLASAEKAGELVRGIIAFSSKQIMDYHTVNLNKIIRKIEQLLVRSVGNEIMIHSKLKEEPLYIKADSSQIELALMNLATNAREAMSHGGSLSFVTGVAKMDAEFVRSHGYGEPGMYAFVSITDTGVGMDDATLERIFEPFFTTKETGEGTGLGMAIVYGIVKQHNGYIIACSEPGKGSNFRIYLPLLRNAYTNDTKESGH